MPIFATLTEIQRVGGTYGFAVWRLIDGTPVVTYHTQAEHDLFLADGGQGELPNRPAPDAAWMMGAGGQPLYNTPTGRPRLGDFYVDATRETWFWCDDQPEWGYQYAIADAPANGSSRLQGRNYAVTNVRLIMQLNNPQINALRNGTFNYATTGLTIVDNAVTVADDYIVRVNAVIDRQIENHRSVTFDATSLGWSNGDNPVTWSHTCTTEADRYFGLFVNRQATTAGSATYNGDALSSATESLNYDGARSLILWEKVAPATGSNTVSVVGTGARERCCVISAYGVDQTTPRSVTATPTTGTSTSPSITIAGGSTDELAISASGTGGLATSPTNDATWTSDEAGHNEGIQLAAGHKTGAASLTKTDTLTASNAWAMLGVSLKAAGGGSQLRGVPRPCFFG